MSGNRFSCRLSLENHKFREFLQGDYGAQKSLTNFLFQKLRAVCEDEKTRIAFFGYISTTVEPRYGDVYFTVELSEENKDFVTDKIPRGLKAKTYNYLMDCLREALNVFKGRPDELISKITVMGADAGFDILPPSLRE